MEDHRPNHLWLTATERLARTLRRRFRKDFLSQGVPAWERPDTISLNAWLDRTWADSWPLAMPAPDLLRMALWKTIVDEHPPPGRLEPSLSLCQCLDDTFSILVRHSMDPAAGFPSSPLVEWRRQASRLFTDRLGQDGLFHPAEMPVQVHRAIERGGIEPPRACTLLGFEFPAPVERDLFARLESLSKARYGTGPPAPRGTVRAVALPDPEQEIAFLAGSLVEDARSLPLHRIGVIAPNLDQYADSLASTLEAVLGKAPPEGEAWFNITLGKPLAALPLFKASLLPLGFLLDNESRERFLALVLSPYYGRWQGRRAAAARVDREWRRLGITGNLDELQRAVTGNDELSGMLFDDVSDALSSLQGALRRGKAPLSFWTDRLRHLWHILGFPLLADETDRLAWRHLEEILDDFREHLKDRHLEGSAFIAWLVHRAARERTQPERPEDAGIQIMGIIEARGLDFDKLYLLDLNDRSLPRPVRPLPLLDSSERSRVQGGTAHSQLAFAEGSLDRLLRSAPHIVLLRAEQEGDQPLTPSPFWPDDHERRTVDIWTDPAPAHIRTPWLRSAWEGLVADDQQDSASFVGVDRSPLPLHSSLRATLDRGLSPSRLKTALACPFLFLLQDLVGMEPLEEATAAPSPRDRGERIHRILASCTAALRAGNRDPALDREEAWRLLSGSVDAALSDLMHQHPWRIERERLLGSVDGAYPGILAVWLDGETAHRAGGWRCRGEEIAFADLLVPDCPFPLRGRIDRIDRISTGEKDGWACFDYKTGRLPSRADIDEYFIEPQLPVYLMALEGGLLSSVGVDPGSGGELQAGYIQVRTPKDTQYRILDGIAQSLPRWRSIIADVARLIDGGIFEPAPYPLSPVSPSDRRKDERCRLCPCLQLCPRGLHPHRAEEDTPGEVRHDP